MWSRSTLYVNFCLDNQALTILTNVLFNTRVAEGKGEPAIIET